MQAGLVAAQPREEAAEKDRKAAELAAHGLPVGTEFRAGLLHTGAPSKSSPLPPRVGCWRLARSLSLRCARACKGAGRAWTPDAGGLGRALQDDIVGLNMREPHSPVAPYCAVAAVAMKNPADPITARWGACS